MKQLRFIIPVFLFACITTSFIAHIENTKSPLKEIFSELIAMPGGTFSTGITLPYSEELLEDTCLVLLDKIKKKKVEPFLLNATEVSVKEWKAFYNDKKEELGEEKAFELFYPDTLVWINDFTYSYNLPMTQNYFWHPAFDDYPIVGIDWHQAKEYCKWLTIKSNKVLKENKIDKEVEFKLPTSSEWEYAALGFVPRVGRIEEVTTFGRYDNSYKNTNHSDWWLHNRWANFGQIRSYYGTLIKPMANDGNLYPGASKSYAPNDFGFYDMAGNVAEWTSSTATILNQEKYNLDDNENTVLTKMYDNGFVRRDSFNKDRNWLDTILAKAKLHDIQLAMGDGEKKVVKGGSWADPLPYLYCSAEEARSPSKKTSRIGFRVAMTYNPDLEEFYKKLGIKKVED